MLSRADDRGEALSKTSLKTVIPGPVYVWPKSKNLSQSKNVIRVKKRGERGRAVSYTHLTLPTMAVV